MKDEPVINFAAMQAFIAAVLTLLGAFGVDLSADQRAAILGVWATGSPILFGILLRRKVTPA